MAATFQQNLRRIRMTETGRWTLLSAADQTKPIHLCDFCTLNRMCLTTKRLAQIVDEFDVSAVISECAGYRPHLSFRDDRGLEGEFNTIRLGKAWHDRVAVGSYVTLWDATKEEEIGTAQVTAKFVGPFRDLVAEHAPKNHTQLGLPREGVEDRMFKVLTRSYGTTFMKPDRTVSVIYMRRIDGEEGERNQDHAG